MEEIRIGGGPRDRRIGFIALAVSLVVATAFGGWAWFAGDPVTAHDARPVAAIVMAAVLFGALYIAFLAFGYTVLSASHLRTRSPALRRSVPWSEISAVELHSRTGRGSTTWMVRVRRKSGRSFIVPGTRLGSSEGAASARLVIEERWAHVTGERPSDPAAEAG
ncbi:PH domain-containing protein [Kitasatospora sp. NBC_01266]|uniref:PH domain-containing protein n=1 Tax=Kitasatospora sp. NBC_01266 TaxID=2903572 RepID=UPI002E30BB7D|nr:hypothetical protein [Kitasatospora sp. NBC_01266]